MDRQTENCLDRTRASDEHTLTLQGGREYAALAGQ